MTADRAATIRGLRALADYAEQHPDVPLPRHGYNLLVSVDDREIVQHAADALEVDTRDRGGCFSACREFDGGVMIEVYVLSEQSRASWAALTSYAGAVSA